MVVPLSYTTEMSLISGIAARDGWRNPVMVEHSPRHRYHISRFPRELRPSGRAERCGAATWQPLQQANREPGKAYQYTAGGSTGLVRYHFQSHRGRFQ